MRHCLWIGSLVGKVGLCERDERTLWDSRGMAGLVAGDKAAEVEGEDDVVADGY